MVQLLGRQVRLLPLLPRNSFSLLRLLRRPSPSGIRGDRALGRIRPLQDSAQGQVVVARNVSVLQGCHALVLSNRGSAAARFVSSC